MASHPQSLRAKPGHPHPLRPAGCLLPPLCVRELLAALGLLLRPSKPSQGGSSCLRQLGRSPLLLAPPPVAQVLVRGGGQPARGPCVGFSRRRRGCCCFLAAWPFVPYLDSLVVACLLLVLDARLPRLSPAYSGLCGKVPLAPPAPAQARGPLATEAAGWQRAKAPGQLARS